MHDLPCKEKNLGPHLQQELRASISATWDKSETRIPKEARSFKCKKKVQPNSGSEFRISFSVFGFRISDFILSTNTYRLPISSNPMMVTTMMTALAPMAVQFRLNDVACFSTMSVAAAIIFFRRFPLAGPVPKCVCSWHFPPPFEWRQPAGSAWYPAQRS